MCASIILLTWESTLPPISIFCLFVSYVHLQTKLGKMIQYGLGYNFDVIPHFADYSGIDDEEYVANVKGFCSFEGL